MPPEPPRPPSPEHGGEDTAAPGTPPSPERDGYQLLGGVIGQDGALPVPDGMSSEDDTSDAEEDQPQSVAELMAALELHGVNTVETTDGDDGAGLGDAGDGAAAIPRAAKESDPSQWPEGALEAERQRQKQAARERLALFSAPASAPSAPSAPLGAEEAEAVRRAMRSIRLPAAEQWASGLSERQWRLQVDRLLGRGGTTDAAVAEDVECKTEETQQQASSEAKRRKGDDHQS